MSRAVAMLCETPSITGASVQEAYSATLGEANDRDPSGPRADPLRRDGDLFDVDPAPRTPRDPLGPGSSSPPSAPALQRSANPTALSRRGVLGQRLFSGRQGNGEGQPKWKRICITPL